MKKYLTFAQVTIKSQIKDVFNELGTIISFIIHISVFAVLWDFVLKDTTIAGFNKKELIWYVIVGEVIMYSFHYYYKKVAYKVEMGDFAYDMTKPFNYLLRTITEGMAQLWLTGIIFSIGLILGIVYAGPINFSLCQIILSLIILFISELILLELNIIVGLLSLWLGEDVSSIWLLVQKSMLIFAFSPLELFPKYLQMPLKFLPTTHVIYTPAKLFVKFSTTNFITSLMWVTLAIILLGIVLYVIYKKGVKKQNVSGI